MNSIIPLQNAPEHIPLLPIAPGVDFGTPPDGHLDRCPPTYLLAPEVSALLYYMPDQAASHAVCNNVEYQHPYW